MSANNANNANYASMPFWHFLQSLDPNRAAAPGEGVDNSPQPGPQFPAGFPFPLGDFAGWGAWGPRGRGPWGGRGGRGSRGGWSGPWGGRGYYPGQTWGDNAPDAPPESENDEDGSPETVREGPGGLDGPHPPPPPPPHYGPHAGLPHHPPHHGPHGHGPPGHPRCPFTRSRGGRGRCGRGGHRGPHRGPPPPYPGGFNLPPWMNALQQHPFAQAVRQYLEQYADPAPRGGEWDGEAGDDVFNPPIDIFNRPTEWQVHVALPGAKKDDIGVNWDADKGTLNVAGVVYRPGDEEFLQSLTATSERKVGMFDRSVKLPPADGDEKDEADAEGISAKLEDGVLVITIPKVERDWTEIRKVDIE